MVPINFAATLTVDSIGQTIMSTVALELDQTLRELDSIMASLLEQAVRDALALAQRRRQPSSSMDGLGYPTGYFAATAGSFADEPLECRESLLNSRA